VLPGAPVPEARSLIPLGERAGQPDVGAFILETNPLERVNREIGRRSDVVGIYPNDASLIRLASMLLVEQNDEWLVGRRYLSQESIALIYADPDRPSGPGEADQPALAGSAGRPRDQKEALAA
jgi:Transposase, Mutator family